MKRRMAGVYGIYCTETGRWYVGASIDVERRIKNHYYDLRVFGKWGAKGEIGWDYVRYGRRAFQDVVLEVVDDPALLAEREMFWVAEKRATTNGYNIQAPGRNRYWSSDNGR